MTDELFKLGVDVAEGVTVPQKDIARILARTSLEVIMSLRTQENLRKQGYAPGENRGNLPVICPTYCEKCGTIFMPETCTDKLCKKCKDKK